MSSTCPFDPSICGATSLRMHQFTKSAQKKIDKYLTCSRKGRGGQLKVGFNDKSITEAKRYFGDFALVSNQTMDTFTALANYRLREKIEELFAVQKGRLDGARPRTWYPDNLRGRQFTQFEVDPNVKPSSGRKNLEKLNHLSS